MPSTRYISSKRKINVDLFCTPMSYPHVQAMYLSNLIAAIFPFAVYSAGVTLPGHAEGSLIPGTSPENNSALIIAKSGSEQASTTTSLLSNSNITNLEFNLPFEYPDLSIDDDDAESTNNDISCKDKWGEDLSRMSCNEVISRMVDNRQLYSWGQRGHGAFLFQLPWRVSSCESPMVFFTYMIKFDHA